MKETKLLAVTAILLLTSCSPKVVTHIVRTYPNPVPADSVYVIEPGDTVPNTAETLGSVSVVDRGTSRNCRYDQVLRLAQEATGKNGGNGLAITEHVKPSFLGKFLPSNQRFNASPDGYEGECYRRKSCARHDRSWPGGCERRKGKAESTRQHVRSELPGMVG